MSEYYLIYIAFFSILAISQQKEVRRGDYALLLSYDFKGSLYAHYPSQHCTLQVCEQLRALYMHNLDHKHPTRLRFEPNTE